MNDTLVQDLDVETVPDLKYRLRRGYLGFESLLPNPLPEHPRP